MKPLTEKERRFNTTLSPHTEIIKVDEIKIIKGKTVYLDLDENGEFYVITGPLPDDKETGTYDVDKVSDEWILTRRKN